MKRGTLLGVLGGVVLLAVIAAVLVWWFTRPQTAEAAARDYLRALEAGDLAAIEGMLPATADETMGAAFASADAHVVDARVQQLTEDDGRATVRADAELDGERRELSFVLTSTDDGWTLTPESFAALRVEPTLGGVPGGGDAVWIGEALAPANTDIALLPALYVIEAAPHGILSGTAPAAVTSDGEVQVVALDTTVAPDAAALAQEQLDAYLDACTAPAKAVPDNCGLRVPWAADLSSLDEIAFRIDERPVLALSADGTRFDATGGVVVATASGTSRAGGSGSFTYRADDWALRGTIAFEGDEMVLAVR